MPVHAHTTRTHTLKDFHDLNLKKKHEILRHLFKKNEIRRIFLPLHFYCGHFSRPSFTNIINFKYSYKAKLFLSLQTWAQHYLWFFNTFCLNLLFLIIKEWIEIICWLFKALVSLRIVLFAGKNLETKKLTFKKYNFIEIDFWIGNKKSVCER